MKTKPKSILGGAFRVALLTLIVMFVSVATPASASFTPVTSTNTTHKVSLYPCWIPDIGDFASWSVYVPQAHAFLNGTRGADTNWSGPTNIIIASQWETTNAMVGTNSLPTRKGRLGFLAKIEPAIATTNHDYSQISLAMIQTDNSSSDNAHSLSGTPNLTSYSPEVIGLDYGLDRIKGTADDRTITSGLTSQLCDEIHWAGGPAVAYRIDTQVAFQNATNYVNANKPFTVWLEMRVTDGQISRSLLNRTTGEGYAAVSTDIGIPQPSIVPGVSIGVTGGKDGVRYVVVGSSTLTNPLWQYVGTVAGSSGTIPIVVGAQPMKFFRILVAL